MHRSDVDDAPAPAVRGHQPRRLLVTQESAGQVGVDHPPPVAGRELEHGRTVQHACRGDQRPQRPERCGHPPEDLAHLLFAAYVQPGGERGAAVVLDLASGILRAALVDVQAGDAVPVCREAGRRSPADAGGRAGDDCQPGPGAVRHCPLPAPRARQAPASALAGRR